MVYWESGGQVFDSLSHHGFRSVDDVDAMPGRVEPLALEVVDGGRLRGRARRSSGSDGRYILDGVIFGHRLGHAGIEVAEAVESVGIGGQALYGDGQHHWRHFEGEQRAPLQLADGQIHQVDGYVFLAAVAPLLEDQF